MCWDLVHLNFTTETWWEVRGHSGHDVTKGFQLPVSSTSMTVRWEFPFTTHSCQDVQPHHGTKGNGVNYSQTETLKTVSPKQTKDPNLPCFKVTTPGVFATITECWRTQIQSPNSMENPFPSIHRAQNFTLALTILACSLYLDKIAWETAVLLL